MNSSSPNPQSRVPDSENDEEGVDQDCAALLRVLADRNRLAIVRLLMRGEMHVGALQESLAVEQSLLSHHLKVLREAGLVQSRRTGKRVVYRLVLDRKSARTVETLDLGCCRISFE